VNPGTVFGGDLAGFERIAVMDERHRFQQFDTRRARHRDLELQVGRLVDLDVEQGGDGTFHRAIFTPNTDTHHLGGL
jgi:hypothetical protein